jgi:hypothetical protein
MQNIGTELELTALANVHGGGFSLWGGPGSSESGLSSQQTQALANVLVQTGKVVYQVGKSIWHAVSSWF